MGPPLNSTLVFQELGIRRDLLDSAKEMNIDMDILEHFFNLIKLLGSLGRG